MLKFRRLHPVELVDPEESPGKREPLSNPELHPKLNRTLTLIVSCASSLLVEETKLYVMLLYTEHKSAI